jgi:hypothetical protein
MFNVMAGGGGEVDASGSPIANGQVSVFARANVGDLEPGYFFRGNGTDLSTQSILSFAFTNANPTTAQGLTPNLVSEVACQAQDGQNDEREQRTQHGRRFPTHAGGDADGGGQPDAGGRGEAADIVAVALLEYSQPALRAIR